MIKTLTLYSLALLLSFSILGPSFMALLENEVDVEVMQDIEEEKKDTKKELEEYEKFFSELPSFSLILSENLDLSSHYHITRTYGHIRDIHSPPPDWI